MPVSHMTSHDIADILKLKFVKYVISLNKLQTMSEVLMQNFVLRWIVYALCCRSNVRENVA